MTGPSTLVNTAKTLSSAVRQQIRVVLFREGRRSLLHVRCARQTSRHLRLENAIHHVGPAISLPAAKDPLPATGAATAPAEAAKELREFAKTLRPCDVALRARTAREARVRHLLRAILGAPAHAAGSTPCSMTGAALHALGPQGVTDALYGMAQLAGPLALGDEMAAILEAVDFEAACGGKSFSRRQLVEAAWALAKAEHWTPKLQGLGARLQSMGGLRALDDWQLSTLLWSFATLSDAPSVLFTCPPGKGRGVRESVLKGMKDRGLCIICWSLCALQQQETEWFTSAWTALAARWARGSLQLDGYTVTQVYQVVRTLQLESGSKQCWTPKELDFAAHAERLHRADLQAKRLRFTRSKDHEDVVRAVIGMGVAHEVEDISTGLAIDISIPELKIAVEVDGQSHFSRDASGRPLGRTAFKRRHLAAMGWTLFPFTPCDLHSAASYAARLQQLRALICERMEV